MTNRPLRVFLCHSSNDKPAVRELYQKLRVEDWIQPWLDEEELYPGEDWDLAIQKAVEESDVVLVSLSNNSITKRGYIQKELRYVVDIALEIPEEEIFIIPLKLEECIPPRSLQGLQYANYFPESQREREFQRLLISLKKRAESLGLKNISTEAVSNLKPKEIKSRFYKRSIHLEYKINADAKVVSNYLLQHYVGVAVFVEIYNSVLQVDKIELFNPSEQDVFQYGFIAKGYKTISIQKNLNVGETKLSVAPVIEPIHEMFVLAVSQGQKDISILSFDTDVRHAHMFTTGLIIELKKAFLVELLNPSQYTLERNEEEPVEEKEHVIEIPKPVQVATPPNKITLSNGMEFMRVPAGKFLMGSTKENKLAYDDERPQHTVDIPYDYWMARFPVTNELYNAYIKAKGIQHPVNGWEKKKNYPIVYVKWNDTMEYCQWLNNSLKGELPSGLVLRLPTEAEWEKAARGEYANEWPWGNDFDKNKCNSREGDKSGTTPVGLYSPQGDSPCGCADMVGNVWEMTFSLRKPYPYQSNDGREDKNVSGRRVLRGGSFFNGNGRNPRCAVRNVSYLASFRDFIGFRVAASLVFS